MKDMIALTGLAKTRMDVLVLGNHVVRRPGAQSAEADARQPAELGFRP